MSFPITGAQNQRQVPRLNGYFPLGFGQTESALPPGTVFYFPNGTTLTLKAFHCFEVMDARYPYPYHTHHCTPSMAGGTVVDVPGAGGMRFSIPSPFFLVPATPSFLPAHHQPGPNGIQRSQPLPPATRPVSSAARPRRQPRLPAPERTDEQHRAQKDADTISLLFQEIQVGRMYRIMTSFPDLVNHEFVTRQTPNGTLQSFSTPAFKRNSYENWAPVYDGDDKFRFGVIVSKDETSQTFTYLFCTHEPKVDKYWAPFVGSQVYDRQAKDFFIHCDPPLPEGQASYLCFTHLMNGHCAPVTGNYTPRLCGVRVHRISGEVDSFAITNMEEIRQRREQFWDDLEGEGNV
ncbi:hypothetical protein BJ508DRAFT_332817 [Ascobolus immersus RN42]|uniref:Uncharacterized protein n=1 Tax=Ascobolus immersus RN42 TaxID=1160509 RepID=A0A3N4HRK9_ASCIM|nr:hypothetical protein BJ508DRAFT_332817 [Ascobolus immersus RN42]